MSNKNYKNYSNFSKQESNQNVEETVVEKPVDDSKVVSEDQMVKKPKYTINKKTRVNLYLRKEPSQNSEHVMYEDAVKMNESKKYILGNDGYGYAYVKEHSVLDIIDEKNGFVKVSYGWLREKDDSSIYIA